MRRLATAAALALALVGSAHADAFRVVPTTGLGVPAVLPSAETPNGSGSIAFPASLLSRPAVVETRTYSQLLDLWQRDGAAYGVPWQVLIGPKGLAEGKVEVKRRADGSRELMTPADAIARLAP